MAFYSLWKWFSPWSKRKYPDMIYRYKEYVLKTPEQREQERIENKRRVNTLIAQWTIASVLCNELGGYY